MPVSGTMSKIEKYVKTLPPGELFAARSLISFGTRAAVDKALSRMAGRGDLIRVARGVYAKPKLNPWIGVVRPAPESVAQAVAQASNAEIQIHGAKAMQLLGLSTQEPTQIIFATTGPTRNVKFGNLLIRLQHIGRNRLSGLDGKSALAFNALLFMGRKKVTPDTVRDIRQKLSSSEYGELLSARDKMPGWLADILLRMERVS